MNLEELVPPLELCKLIPKGEFEDSVLCWVDLREQFTISVNPYVTARELSNRDVSKIGIPAPTLEEIIEFLPIIYSPSKASYALELWLKLKGIEV